MEAMEDTMDRSLSIVMMPLLENLPPSQCLAVGRKHFGLPDLGADPAILCAHLLAEDDWVTVALTLFLIAYQGLDVDQGTFEKLRESEDTRISQIARWVIHGQQTDLDKTDGQMELEIRLPDKITHLRGIQLFDGLSVSELATVAAVTEETSYPPGEFVVKVGDPLDKMYMVVEGQVSVMEGWEGEADHMELVRFEAGDTIGQMSLFGDLPPSLSVRTTVESRFLVLHKASFAEIVKEYPEMALRMAKELSSRLRLLQEKVKHYENNFNSLNS
jgi:hypothetical protein